MSTIAMLCSLLIGGPILAGALVFILRPAVPRNILICVSSVLIMAGGLLLVSMCPGEVSLDGRWDLAATILEALVILIVFVLGVRTRSLVVIALSTVQFFLCCAGCWLSFKDGHATGEVARFLLDPLSLILILVITLVGSPIVIYAIGYMKEHEHHAPKTAASNSQFFFFLLAFLGFMNGLVLSDNLKWLAFFWESTTLCSFFLIGHDGTPIARQSARRALVLNTIGGAAMTVAGTLTSWKTGSESLSGMMAASLLLPMALMCLASLTKSAQMPFQSWLLGAMVAPTPVSALLHSSTMVKAGSYLVLRMAPALADTPIASVLALAGAFTFLVTSAMAIAQSNAKKVLAYSTIANLGLIVACVGINTPLAYAAALTILIFHAVSKAILFLCVGSIEQKIGSRDIEDMSGIFFRMPLTTTVAIVGMVSMIVPPFGMLIGKWMALESSIHHPLILMLLVLGSALTIFFWAKWIGRIATVSYHRKYQTEDISPFVAGVPVFLLVVLIGMALCSMCMYRTMLCPLSIAVMGTGGAASSVLLDAVGQLTVWPFATALLCVLVVFLISAGRCKEKHIRLPYLGGENVKTDDTERSYMFRSIKDATESAQVSSYYLAGFLGEAKVTSWANPVALIILLALFGVLLK